VLFTVGARGLVSMPNVFSGFSFSDSIYDGTTGTADSSTLGAVGVSIALVS